jgi:sugar/nucleoside kinase (ribokinase family)
MGDRGLVLVDAKQRLRADSFRVPFVDGTGGGDAFAAGYICGLLQGLDAEGCLTLGSALGASCVQAIGTTAGVFTRPQCEEFLRTNRLTIERL